MTNNFYSEFLQSGALISLDDGSVVVGWGKAQAVSHAPNSNFESEGGIHPVFYFPDFFLTDQAPWRIYAHWQHMTLAELQAMLQKIPEKDCADAHLSWLPADKELFRVTFDKLKMQFAQGELYKAVPYLFTNCKAHFTKERLQRALLGGIHGAQKHPVHVYGFWDETGGLVGVTPEVLFQCCQDSDYLSVKTMACAGTQSLAENENEFLSDPKQIDEHRHVIQGIRDSLLQLGGSVTMRETQVRKLAHLAHLVTPIQALLPRNTSFDSFVQTFHPTPALGAVPQQEGTVWLKDYEKLLPRYRFGAPVGLIFPAEQRWDCLVAIRNVQWHNSWMGIAAGCGIVAASDFESEWEELCLKIKSTKEMLAL